MQVQTVAKWGNSLCQIPNSPNTSPYRILMQFEQGGQCQYHNYVKIEKNLDAEQNFGKLKIVNNICENKGSSYLEKVIQIEFEGQTISITNVYSFGSPEQNVKENLDKKRTFFFNKSLLKSSKPNSIRLTKNMAKNFIKAFIKHLQQNNQNSQIVEKVLRELHQIKKFNNSSIQRIIDSQSASQFFRSFLKNYAKQWILNSKIQNKDSHIEAINIYLQLKKSEKNCQTIKQQTSECSSYFKDLSLVGLQENNNIWFDQYENYKGFFLNAQNHNLV